MPERSAPSEPYCQHMPGAVLDLVGPHFFMLFDVAGFIIVNSNAADKSRLRMALSSELIYIKCSLGGLLRGGLLL